MTRRASSILVFVALTAFAGTAAAQRNPFGEGGKKKKGADAELEQAIVAATAGTTAALTTAAAEAETQAAADAAAALLAEEEAAAEAAAAEEEVEDEEVVERPRGRAGLTENFGRVELITTAVVLPVGLGLAIGGPALFGEPDASMTSPRLGSLDYRLSIASHGDLVDGKPFAAGIFDVGGIVVPAALGTFYLVSGLYLWGADEPMLGSQSINIDHSMVGMAQTVGWTAAAAGLVHLFVGREKPYVAFGRTAYGEPGDTGSNLSFFSTATALSFAMSSFAARDFSAWAREEGHGLVLGTVLPYTVLYGLSGLIGYSAIFGQQHYMSDIAVSAVTGALIGNLVWAAHFDQEGRPRRDRASKTALAPTLVVSPDAQATLGVGFNTLF